MEQNQGLIHTNVKINLDDIVIYLHIHYCPSPIRFHNPLPSSRLFSNV